MSRSQQEALQWVSSVLGRQLSGDFHAVLKDGTVLCEVVNKIRPNTCKKFKKSNVAYVCRTNIQIYLDGCQALGVPQQDCFESRDLYDAQRLTSVMDNIYALSAASRNVQGFNGPYIGVAYAKKNVRNFTEAQLAKSKSAVPAWNRGDIGHTSKNMDGMGIIKVDKNMQKHTGALSQWEKGSRQNDLSSGHDSYGIVTNSSVQKHSGVLSTWEKGSRQNDLSSGHDSYGIVTNKSMQQHTGVLNQWEKGSRQNDLSSGHDSYGIVTNKAMQNHTGVQSTWEKGSIRQNQSSQHDSYGVVRQPKHLG